MTTPEEIKKWLKGIGQDRSWLAEQCYASKRTVDNWLAPNGKIPSKALLIIQDLMHMPESKKTDAPYDFPDVSELGKLFITLPPDVQEIIENEARRLNIKVSAFCSLAVEYCATTPDGNLLMDEIIEEIQQKKEKEKNMQNDSSSSQSSEGIA